MQMFRPRSWRVRADAAEARTRKDESLHDLHRIRAALSHGEAIPQDAVASLETRERALKAARGEAVAPAIEGIEADTPAKPAPVRKPRA